MLIQYMADIEPNSLFTVNAISLAAFAIAFFCIWLKQRDRTYWLYWVAANAVLSVGFIIFVVIDRSQMLQLILVNVVLATGIALRWQAIRSFFYRKNYIEINFLIILIVLLPYLFSSYLTNGFIFGFVNLIFLVEIVLVLRELLRPNGETLPSRWGLAIAYSLVAAAFVARVIQGWVTSPANMKLLPNDGLLAVILLVMSIHIVASGAFAISMAYERGISELKQMALLDPLTGLYNRRAFELTLAERDPADGSLALILLDIDHFKRINDQFGHAAGDIALQRFANILMMIFRKKDFIARIGGEEFAVLLPDTTMNEAYEFAERVRKTAENDAFEHSDGIVRLTISAGVCQAATDVTSFSDMTQKADISLYIAKNNGRNRVEIFAT
ncbi:GGDEF domain-containing protein [Pseudochrobactrum sp. XF203]|uniref:GGDEF domain-containing protein n=1 Tax=Pseudochrobactrum sp. XF203 TaxID=2879116 RepID=UPI001CE2450B|nr:GGDEF domain-containing protein [Pseudochrobactrum sp. XF203]UCA46390.1 GGDEF domain-containing protein [Pseudochrobactrum sp. XF203]